MTKFNYKLSTIIIIVIIFPSCAGYYVSVDEFKNQFAYIDSSQLQIVKVKGIYGEIYQYKANSLSSINCYKNDNNQISLPITPSSEICIKYKKNKKIIFYLDGIYVSNGLLFGHQSKISSNYNCIKLEDIISIQYYNSQMGFEYVLPNDTL